MKNGKLKRACLFVCVLAMAFAFGACKHNDDSVEGAYKFSAPTEEKTYSVLFKLNNPGRLVGDGIYEPTAYVSLKGVYFKFRRIEGDSVSLKLEQCRKVNNEFQKEIFFDAKVNAKKVGYGTWYEPFDLSGETLGNRAVDSYEYYRLYSTDSECYVDEIVFVGEILTGKDSNTGTGEYCIIPVQIEAATPQGSESAERALRNARLLINEQPSSVGDVIK